MTTRIEKTVFISYRRRNIPWARAVYQDLTIHGYDAFFDFQSINSGDFSRVILENIKARAHFLLLLTPSALERCNDPNDWLRREIETALETKRNIVPLMLDGFDFGSPTTSKQLVGKLAFLKNYNGLRIYSEYFEEGMNRLRERFLNIPLEAVMQPVSKEVKQITNQQQDIAKDEPTVKQKELTAQEWFEKGNRENDLEEQVYCYTEAIRLEPNYAAAYVGRANARDNNGDYLGAIKDYSEAIRIQPDYATAYFERAVAHEAQDFLDDAIADFTTSIKFDSRDDETYNRRGGAREKNNDIEGAIQDYTKAIKINPKHAHYYYNRGNAYYFKMDLDNAIQDLTQAIRINPKVADYYWARGNAWYGKEDFYSAIADYQKYFELGGNDQRVEQYLGEAKTKIGK